MEIDLSQITQLEEFTCQVQQAEKGAEFVLQGQTSGALRAKLLYFIEEAVCVHAGIEHEKRGYLVKKIVQQLLFNYDIDSGSLRQVDACKQILDAMDRDVQACGCCARVYPQMEFQEGEEVRNVIRWLFGNPQIVGHDFSVITSKLLKAATVHKDNELLMQARKELEMIGQRLCLQLRSGAISVSQQRLTEIFLGQILALYPFFEPGSGEVLTLPQKIEGRWELVSFVVDQIPLTPSWLGPPMLAFGLLPTKESPKNSRPRILFPGTSQPTASWSPLDTWSDFVPGHSVGEFVFNRWAKGRLKSWMEDTAKQPVDISGISLGGSLTLLSVVHLSEYIGQATAYVPPALRESVVRRYDASMGPKPDTSLYWQDGDIVSHIGAAWSSSWHAYRLIPGKPLDFISAHNKAFSAQPLTAVVRIDPEKDSRRLGRKILNGSFALVCIPIFPLLTLGILIRAFLYKSKKT